MKLRRAAEPRINRSTRAGEVLRPPELPHTPPWDARDPELFTRWLESARSLAGIELSYCAVDLELIGQIPVRPEIRQVLVAAAVNRMKREVSIWGKREQPIGFGISKLAKHILPAWLLDPKALFDAPQKFWNEMHELMQDKENWHRNWLRFYVLQFPGKLDPASNQMFEYLEAISAKIAKDRMEDDIEIRAHELIADVATMRLVAPQHFGEVRLSGGEREEIQQYLQRLRRKVEMTDEPVSAYPEELFLAMVALADEVTFSKGKGLQIRFTQPMSEQTPPLPERNMV